MSDSFKSIPDPLLPEHRLLKDAADLPVLSRGLRDRVLLNVHTQARYGRWMDRLRIVAATAAALLLVTCVWNFRQTGPDRMAETPVVPMSETQTTAPTMSTAPSTSMHAASPPTPIELRDERPGKGGSGSPRLDLNEMQQINKLIEHYQQRQNGLCGILPFL